METQEPYQTRKKLPEVLIRQLLHVDAAIDRWEAENGIVAETDEGPTDDMDICEAIRELNNAITEIVLHPKYGNRSLVGKLADWPCLRGGA